MDCFTSLQQCFYQQENKNALVLTQGKTELESMTFSQLHVQIVNIRAFYKAKGFKVGDSVLLLAGNSPKSLSVLLACFSMGLVAVPVNPRLSLHELLDIVDDIQPVMVFTDSSLTENTMNSLKRKVKTLVSIDDKFAVSKPKSPVCFVEYKSKPALVMYTSGSSGIPKKIIYCLAQLKSFMRKQDFIYRQYSDVKGKEVFTSDLIVTLPIHHFGGLSLCLQSLMMGRTLHLLTEFMPVDYMHMVKTYRVRMLVMIPSILQQVINIPNVKEMAKSLRYCVTMGEHCPDSLRDSIAKALDTKVYFAYGLSECMTGICHHRLRIEAGDIPQRSCGTVLFGEVRLLDESDEEADYGELWVRNDTCFACYGSVELNQQRFSEGWFRTGDILKRDEKGNYFHCGRKDSMFIVNGKNIYPEEIENILSKLPCVATVVVVPLTSVCGKVIPGALIKLTKGNNHTVLSKESVIDYYLANGSMHTTPGWIGWFEELPVNSTGKIDKLQCATLLQDDYEANFCKLAC